MLIVNSPDRKPERKPTMKANSLLDRLFELERNATTVKTELAEGYRSSRSIFARLLPSRAAR